MKRVLTIFSSLFLAFALFLAPLSANTQLDSAYQKLRNFYSSGKTTLDSPDEVIAATNAGLDLSKFQLPDLAGQDFSTIKSDGAYGNLNKTIMAMLLAKQDPRNAKGTNLLKLMESFINNDGSISVGGNKLGHNKMVWAVYVLSIYNPTLAIKVADNLVNEFKNNGNTLGYVYQGYHADITITAWGMQALNVLDASRYALTINTIKQAIAAAEDDQAGWDAYGYGHDAATQAAILETLASVDKAGLDAGKYDKNGVSPYEVLIGFQGDNGAYPGYAGPVDAYTSAVALEAMSTYYNGSIVGNAKKAYIALTTPAKTPSAAKSDTTNNDAGKDSVKAGDNTNILGLLLMSVIAGGVLIRRSYAKA